MRNFPGLLSNFENAVAHAQQSKLLSDGIVIGELQSSIPDSPVPERGGESTLGSNGDGKNSLPVQEVVFDPHWINQLAVKSDDFVRCPALDGMGGGHMTRSDDEKTCQHVPHRPNED
jgi:hypothetical protein